MKVAAVIFLALASLLLATAETSSSLPVSIVYGWDQLAGARTNVASYVVLHGGPDGRLTNYATVRPFNVGRLGTSWPMTFEFTLSKLPQGTNYVGVTAVLKSGVAVTNVSVFVNYSRELK